jgi:4-carboxymuconolactone decarboxylase
MKDLGEVTRLRHEPGGGISPLPVAERSPSQRSLLESVQGDSAPNLFSTIVRNPELYEAWLPFCMKLLRQSAFQRRERELIILRTAWRCGAHYEWRHHIPIGKRAGLSDDAILQICGAAPSTWSEGDAALVAAVDELYGSQRISAETIEDLKGSLSSEQMIELPMLVGHYVLLAGVLNSFSIVLDDGVEDFGYPDPGAESGRTE